MVVLSTLRRISLIDEEILLLALFFRRGNRRKCRSRRQRRWGVHPINRRRKAQGAYHKHSAHEQLTVQIQPCCMC
ncbi:hypothetical protein HOLleu_03967 [Holothuria leucospilota]|uniref:Uncharacterized protein n=1 Tax=Holothuria leucospilota TaxID=206669 RepID=A0A9Q1CRF4_HOLLE|nr:hypothetical protein HOLleu_03967 [Holothuria leucospilota]